MHLDQGPGGHPSCPQLPGMPLKANDSLCSPPLLATLLRAKATTTAQNSFGIILPHY